ncbi:MAG: hypothetical protein WB681_05665 [Candidatus Cybelea sp.]
MTRLIALITTIATLAGCAIRIGQPPDLTVAAATQLLTAYYDSCHDVSDIGQCAIIVPIDQSDPGHISIVPAFRDWVRLHHEPQIAASSHAPPDRILPVLTEEGARHAYSPLSATRQLPGASAMDTVWDYAPATVRLASITQRHGVAAVVARASFTPISAIAQYLRDAGAYAAAGTPLQTLARAQNLVVRIRMTYDGGAWIIGG